MRRILMMIAVSAALAHPATATPAASARLVTAAESHMARGDYIEAIGTLESAIVAHPANVKAFEALGRAYFGMGRYVQAQKYFSIAIEIDPTAARSLALLGEIDLRNHEIGSASARLDQLSRVCGVQCAEYKRLAVAISRAEGASVE